MRLVIALGLLLSPAVSWSQQKPVPQGHAVFTGVVVDSVHGGFLRGAIVSVSGTTRSAITDSAGRFRVDSVPPGSHYLQVMHPFLDSIALGVRTAPVETKPVDSTFFIVSVPSPETIIAVKCSDADRERGAGALVGRVADADTETPSTGAIVSVEWTEYQLNRRSMAKLPQRRAGTVRADGSYRVCGIPDDLSTGVQAYRGADSTGLVSVSFQGKLAVVSFHLPPPGTGQAAQPSSVAATAPSTDSAGASQPRGTGVLTGRVVDPSGTPLANARIAVEADEAAAISDNKGAFRLTGLRAGTRSLSIRRIGFASVEMPVDVSLVTPRAVTVTMSRYVAMLDPVRVTALSALGLERVGFTDRERTAAGKFYTPEEIRLRNPQRLSMLLETAPQLRSGSDAQGHRYMTGRHNGCVGYFVDGRQWFSTDPTDVEISPDAFIAGGELGAVEVYDELSAPAEYQRWSTKGQACAVVVVWTKQKLGT